MQVKGIAVNAAGMLAAERGIQGNRNQTQPKGNMFGAECRVTISQEGQKLSRRQTAQKEKDAQGTQSLKEERMLLRQQEEAELSKKIREGYREDLNEIDKQITAYNNSYNKFEMKKVAYDAALMDKTLEEQQKLKEAMQSQKQFQAEEGQRKAREAQQMAMQSAQYKEEIDENNRDLVTLLKTMEEAEKAKEEQENCEAEEGGRGESVTGNSASDVIQSSATQFVASSLKREEGVQELLAKVGESGHWFLDTANSITTNVLQRSADIRAALEDESFTDGQIAEMIQSFQENMALNYDNVEKFRSFGLQVLRDVQEDKLQHIADNPLKGMQEIKKSMMLSAADAALGEARQSTLDKASQELEDEVKKLIDERNDVDKIQQDKKEEEEEQAKKAEDEEEQAKIS